MNLLIKIPFFIYLVVSFMDPNYAKANSTPEPEQVILNETDKYLILPNGIKLSTYCSYGALSKEKINQIILTGKWQQRVDDIFYEVLKYIPSKATMLEVGAYWSYYSLLFSHVVDNPSNFILEPHPDHLRCGIKNFELNQKKGYFYRFYFGFDYEKKISHSHGSIHMQMDWFIVQNDIDHIDVLFIDSQGSELDVLTSSVEAIEQNKIDYFFIATHSFKKHENCLNFFTDKNFQILVEYLPSKEIKDGLILAKRLGIPGPNYIKVD